MFGFISKLFKSSSENTKSRQSIYGGQNTIGDIQNLKITEWVGDYRDVVIGMRFFATMQLRTPLSVLEHHDELFTDFDSAPPCYITELWQGIWTPDIERSEGMPKNDSCSSDIGYVNPSEYHPFLVDFRKIVERTDFSVDDKLKLLEQLENKNKQYKDFWERLTKAYKFFPKSFFYNQFTVISGIGTSTAKSLFDAGFKTIEELQKADELELLKIKGIGKSVVRKIQEF